MTEATVVQKRIGGEQSRVPLRVGSLQRELQPMPHFVLYDESANFIGRAKRVMLSPGHGPLSFPPVLAKGPSVIMEPEPTCTQRTDISPDSTRALSAAVREESRERPRTSIDYARSLVQAAGVPIVTKTLKPAG